MILLFSFPLFIVMLCVLGRLCTAAAIHQIPFNSAQHLGEQRLSAEFSLHLFHIETIPTSLNKFSFYAHSLAFGSVFFLPLQSARDEWHDKIRGDGRKWRQCRA